MTSFGRIQPAAVATTDGTSQQDDVPPAEPNRGSESMTNQQAGIRNTLPLSLTSSLQRDLQQNIPLDRTRIPSSSASSSYSKNSIYTDIALGRSIQNVMRPSSIGGSRFATALSSTVEHHQDDALCKTACNFLKSGNSHSIASCTANHPHKCVQDLIKEELGGGFLNHGPGSGSLSNAGSLVNIHIESELQQHGGLGAASGGYQSNPGSGRTSPSHQMFHHGSPPKHLSAIGHSISIPSSTRVSRAPSPSFLHAVAGEHPRLEQVPHFSCFVLLCPCHVYRDWFCLFSLCFALSPPMSSVCISNFNIMYV